MWCWRSNRLPYHAKVMNVFDAKSSNIVYIPFTVSVGFDSAAKVVIFNEKWKVKGEKCGLYEAMY